MRQRLLMMFTLTSMTAVVAPCLAQDNVPGAIWTMRFTNVAGPKRVGLGVFRIHNGTMYQTPLDVHVDPKDLDVASFTRRVGTSVANKKTHKNRFDFTDGVVYKAGGVPSSETFFKFSGVGHSTLQTVGDWKGTFTDSNGRNWNFVAKRIREF